MTVYKSPFGDATVEVPPEGKHEPYAAAGWTLAEAGDDEKPEPKRRGRPPKTEDK